MGLRLAVLACSVALLTACGATTSLGAMSTTSPSSSTSTSVAPAGDPTALVGSWLVTDAQDSEPGAVLRLGTDLSLWRSCGYLDGDWRADGSSLFAASLFGGDGGCMTATGAVVPSWLAHADRFAVDPDGITLMSYDGTVVAHLRPGGRPTAGPNLLPSLADPPVLTPELTAVLTPARPLPPTLTPATRAQLVGTWVSALPRHSSGLTHDTAPHITLAADGTYTGSDGCNGSAGSWRADDHGAVLGTGGFSTSVGCDNVTIDQWLISARHAGFDGAFLVLVDKDGQETGRLRPA